MGFTYSWYHASRHATYSQNDVLKFTGNYYTSADGLQVYGTHNNTSRYFYGYYTNSSWVVLAPICFSYAKNHAWAFAKPESIISGGTLDTYTIKYNANGGSGAPSSQTKTHDSNLTLSSTIPTRDGHNFLGWSDSPSGSKKWDAGGTFTWNSNTTLYALWSPYKHTVAFNANGGSNAPSSQTKTYGSSLKLSSVVPTRDGHTFLGWGTSKTDTSVDYNAGADYGRDQNGGTYTLYAIWSPHTYSVNYNANGGKGAPNKQTKTYGVNLTLSNTIPTRDNHTFLGWGTTSNDTSVDYNAGSTYSKNEGITLYAIWKLNNYFIDYVLNGGTNSIDNKTSVLCGTTTNLYAPTKEGYTFVGWHLNSQNGNIISSIPSTNTSNVTLYAEWKINTYTIKIDLDGGKYNESTTVANIKADYGSTIDLFIPEREHYDFNKWSIEGLGSVSSDNLKFTVGASDVTLKAVWGLEVLTVTYNTNGGIFSNDGGNFTSTQYHYGDDISKYEVPIVARDSYKFLGWYIGDKKVESPYTIEEDIDLVAKWKKIDTCYAYTTEEYEEGLPHVFIKDENGSLKAEEGFIYVFKNGRFIRGYTI